MLGGGCHRCPLLLEFGKRLRAQVRERDVEQEAAPLSPHLVTVSQYSNTFSFQDKSRCFALIKTNKDFSVLNRLIFLDTKVRRKRTLSHSVHKNKDSA